MVSVLQGLNEICRSLWLHATNSSAHPSYWFCRTMWPWFISVQPTEPSQYRILQAALYRLQNLLTLSVYVSFYCETFTFVATDKLCSQVAISSVLIEKGLQTCMYIVLWQSNWCKSRIFSEFSYFPFSNYSSILLYFFFILILTVFLFPFPNALFSLTYIIPT